VQTLPTCKGRAVFSLGDDSRRALGCRRRRGSPSGSDCHCAIRNSTTRDCIFPLDTTRDWPQNPCNFSTAFLVQGSSVGKSVRRSRGRRPCSICRVGPCSVLIRNVWLAATGCVPAPPEANFAPTVMPRSTMFRRRWALACGYDLAHSVVTVPRVVPPGVRGSRRSRADWARSSRPSRDEPSPQEFPSLFLRSELKWNFDCSLRPSEQDPRASRWLQDNRAWARLLRRTPRPSWDKKYARKRESGRGAPAARGLGRCLEGSLWPKLTRPVRAARQAQE